MPMEESSYYVTMGIDIFGYMFYASFLISPIPGFLVNRLKGCLKTTDERAEMHGLSLLLGLAVGLAVILSVQMCIKGSIPNGIAVVIEFSFLRTVFFIMRSLVRKLSSIRIYKLFIIKKIRELLKLRIQLLYTYFPEEHFGMLYAISLIPISGYF